MGDGGGMGWKVVMVWAGSGDGGGWVGRRWLNMDGYVVVGWVGNVVGKGG